MKMLLRSQMRLNIMGIGFSYLVSLDYVLSDRFSIRIGFNGNYAKAYFIREAVVNNHIVNEYLDEAV